MEESKGERSNMHEHDELSSCRSMKFGTESPAQFAVPETVHSASI